MMHRIETYPPFNSTYLYIPGQVNANNICQFMLHPIMFSHTRWFGVPFLKWNDLITAYWKGQRHATRARSASNSKRATDSRGGNFQRDMYCTFNDLPACIRLESLFSSFLFLPFLSVPHSIVRCWSKAFRHQKPLRRKRHARIIKIKYFIQYMVNWRMDGRKESTRQKFVRWNRYAANFIHPGGLYCILNVRPVPLCPLQSLWFWRNREKKWERCRKRHKNMVEETFQKAGRACVCVLCVCRMISIACIFLLFEPFDSFFFSSQRECPAGETGTHNITLRPIFFSFPLYFFFIPTKYTSFFL